MLDIFNVGLFLIGFIPLSDSFTTTTLTYQNVRDLYPFFRNKKSKSIIFLAHDESIPSIPTNFIQSSDSDVESLSLHTNSTLSTTTTTALGNQDIQPKLSLSQSVLLLNVVAILWGTQHAVIKLVVEDSNVAIWSLTRFGLAALLASPFTPKLLIFPSNNHSNTIGHDNHNSSNSGTTDQLIWRWGTEMGFYMFLGYAFQAIGLEFTTAQRSGFLLYLNVKFVPFLARILLGRSISIPTWVSALIAFLGTALLSWDGTHTSLNVGDLWSIAAAVASALFILRLERASQVIQDSAALNSATLWIVTLLSLLWCILWCILNNVLDASTPVIYSDPWALHHVLNNLQSQILSSSQQILDSVMNTIHQHPWELIYLGGITTALSNYIQTKAQGGISAERAAVIYAMDPVYGAITSYFVLGEQLTAYGLIGALLITVAAAVNTSVDFTRPSITKEENN